MKTRFAILALFLASLSPLTYGIDQPSTLSGIYIRSFGNPNNPALIFVHGGPGYDSTDFEATTAPWLAQHNYFVVVYDQRGQGRSEIYNPAEYSYQQYASDLNAVIESQKLIKPSILAHSHGGPIALAFMKQFSEKVDKVILISAPLDFSGLAAATNSLCKTTKIGSDEQLGQLQAIVDFISGSFDEKDYASTINLSALFSYAIKCGAYNGDRSVLGQKMSDTLAKMKPIPFDPNKQALYGFMYYENYFRKTWFDTVAKYSEKIWGIYGGHDGLFTDADRQKIKNNLKPGHYHLLQTASHPLYRQQPEAFLDILREIKKHH